MIFIYGEKMEYLKKKELWVLFIIVLVGSVVVGKSMIVCVFKLMFDCWFFKIR